VSVKPKCLLIVKVYLKTYGSSPILKEFLIENIFFFVQETMQYAYKCTVFTLL
jgi:hypothetical protein